MASFCPVAPAHIYEELDRVDHLLVRTTLLLAHDVVANPKAYARVFRESTYCKYSIMDNSLVELGGAVDVQMVKEAVRITGSQVFVLPDVMSNGRESTERTIGAYSHWSQIIPGLGMAVVQGKDLNEWLWSLQEIAYKLPQIHWIGIPRATEKFVPKVSRRVLAEYVNTVLPNARIHLLGFKDDMWDDFVSAQHHAVSSIDSAVPLRLASKGIPMFPNNDAGPRGDWWEHAEFVPLMAVNTSRAIGYCRRRTYQSAFGEGLN